MTGKPHRHQWTTEVPPDGFAQRWCACGALQVKMETRWVADKRRYFAPPSRPNS